MVGPIIAAARAAQMAGAASKARKGSRFLKSARVNAKLAQRKLRPVVRGAKTVANSPVASGIRGAGAGTGTMMKAGAGFAGAAAFGAASSLTGKLVGNLGAGLPLIFFALLVDLIAIDFLLKDNDYHLAIHAIMGALMYGIIMKRDKLVLGIVALNFLPLIISQLPGSDFTLVIANTIGNPFIPWWFIYAGFLRNERQGKLAGIIFWAFVLVFLAIGYKIGGAQIAETAGIARIDLTDEQKATAQAAKGGIINAVKTLGKDAFDGIRGVPKRLTEFFIDVTGTQDVFGPGKSRQEPKLGIRIVPIDPARAGDKVIARANLEILAPLEGGFLTISDITCWREKEISGRKAGTIIGYTPEQLQEGIKMFYGRTRTVSCEFAKEDIDGVSEVKLEVQYHINANGNLKTYFMKEDLLEELLISGKDPIAFMDLKSTERVAITEYDNTPARFGIGPEDLNKPPVAIKEGNFGFFTLWIGNRPEFDGKIAQVNSIQITLPDRVNLTGESCIFTKYGEGNSYIASPEQIEQNRDLFFDIESKRVFSCPMEIVDTDLGILGYHEAEFRVNMDFTYQVEKDLSVTVS